jgi:hypothetical protein
MTLNKRQWINLSILIVLVILGIVTKNIFKGIMSIGLFFLVFTIGDMFSESLQATISKLVIGIIILFIGGSGQAFVYPDQYSFDQATVTEQKIHRTNFSEEMTKRLQHEYERELQWHLEDPKTFSKPFPVPMTPAEVDKNAADLAEVNRIYTEKEAKKELEKKTQQNAYRSYHNGESIEQIAQEANVSTATIYEWFYESGTLKRPKK